VRTLRLDGAHERADHAGTADRRTGEPVSWDDIEALVGLGGQRGTTTHPVIYQAHRFRNKDQDWNDSGFVLVDHVRPHRVEEEDYPAYCSWATLSESLEWELAA
jgi:hypothetical protein